LTRRRALVAGLVLLGVLHLWWGLWALFAARHFFDTFPGFGQHWTAAYPPYNAHLVWDAGATFTTLGVLLLVAAVLRDRRAAAVVLLGVLLFSTLHLAFHAAHPGALRGAGLAASLVSLVFGVVLPAGLLVLARRP
jgi:hypothetical protein